jgi:hypothetical protein
MHVINLYGSSIVLGCILSNTNTTTGLESGSYNIQNNSSEINCKTGYLLLDDIAIPLQLQADHA